MTQTTDRATSTVAPRVEPRPSQSTTRTLLLGGVAAGPLFLAVSLIQAMTRDGFDLTRNAFSQLSLGELGWVQVTNFVLTAVLATAGAIGIRRTLRGNPGGTWAPRLTGVFATTFLLAAAFRADPGAGFPPGAPDGQPASMSAHGTVHMLSAAIGFLSLCAAFLVLARHFATQRQTSWAFASRLVPVGVVAGFAASCATVLAFTIGAALGLLWLSAIAVRLIITPPLQQ